MVKRLSTMRETRVQSLGGEDLLEKEMATHSIILAWKISWTEEPGGLQPMGSQRVRHDWETSHTNFRIVCSISVKNAIGILTGIALSFQIALNSMDILTILLLPIRELGISICVFFNFFQESFYSFQCTGLSPLWLNLFLGILLFFI